ncbi:MAG: methyltransferase domain-containing protein [Spirochaetaceae bacterium]|nr:methyltransferase domain-containing protein [Spirochaetaceae bacterium]
MAQQNIYDNEIFFAGYKKIRENQVNANNLFEIPALFSMMPNLKDKTILDLGCGFGEHCKGFVERGAKKVIGIDISEKMLEIAKQENADSKITYINMPMENIFELTEKFDIVISSLAFHYVEDFAGVVKNVYNLLNENGAFIFSQENPLCTCHSGGQRWTKDENGNKLYLNLSNYGIEGERESTWFVDDVKKYHRTFSSIINTLIETGFKIEKLIEPLPTEDLLKKYPDYKDLFHKPDFLLVKCTK